MHHGQGEQERAIAAWREALRLFQELGDPQADEVQKLLDGAAG